MAMATPYDSIQVAFRSVIHDFKDKLHDDKLYNEILKITSIDEVYEATDRLQKDQAKTGHLRHLSKIEPYLERLRDYSGAIETLVQAKPDILALIWGPIKLLLQWTSILKQSFDAIINTTAEVGELLPEFKEVSQLFGHNVHLKDVLVLFFQDILDFYLVSLKFFNKPRWRYIFESLWPKQRDSIKVVITHITRHTSLMRNEVRLEHIREEHDARLRALEHFEESEKSNRQREYHTIKIAISPKFYDDKLDWVYGRICEGTGKWLMGDSTFAKWLDVADLSTKIIWLQGIPGAGKTFLAGTIIDQAKTAGRVIFAFLSHVHSSSTSALSILHSLIFQLASDDDDLQAALCQSSRKNLENSITVAVSLLTTLLNGAGPVYIIIDGVDEIDEVERGRLLRQLLDLSKDCEETKILISCRPEADITTILSSASASIRVDNRNASSIQAFVNRQSHRWFQARNFLPNDRADIERLLAPVAANAKGMFLYAKVLLSSIELLTDVKSIREELRVLPENLDAAYARILKRVNNLRSAVARNKARNILGWIGCSPTPLKIQELEQALLVDVEDVQSSARVSSSLNIVELCGPIVEVIDEYVQFVHFTVKEYIFNPSIDGYIDYTEATLNLTKCCIWYLCQSHHNAWITDDEITDNIISGDYRLHDYAVTIWLDLVKHYVRLNGSKPLSIELIHALECLMTDRSSSEFAASTDLAGQSHQPDLEKFKNQWPELHTILCHMAQFHWRCSTSEYHMSKGDVWTSFDPLTICHISISIYTHFDGLLCRNQKHEDGCYCCLLERHYGRRPFKCDVLGCSFRRHGFTERVSRDSHVRHHDRPWKCGVQSCEYAQIGFLSRRMRDEHLDSGHQEAKPQAKLLPSNPDLDETQPLFFDLIRLDKVEEVNRIFDYFSKLNDSVQKELKDLVASSGSASMAQVVCNGPPNRDFLVKAIKVMNFETFRWCLSHIDSPIKELHASWLSDIIGELIKSESLEMFQECEKYLIDRLSSRTYGEGIPAHPSIEQEVIEATSRDPDREKHLLSLWATLKMRSTTSKFDDRFNLGDALLNVGKTTCSLALAKALLEYGAEIDFRRSDRYMTPLHYAARQSSPQAAELVKLFLYQGANPELQAGRSKLKISEEKGPKEIAKWLEMSWDELVQKIKLDRERGICPTEYK
ncbi:hypothetical protein MMC22_007578 [Lobaria immixta]|nr:hypothetical protein [Lobaria immixta]